MINIEKVGFGTWFIQFYCNLRNFTVLLLGKNTQERSSCRVSHVNSPHVSDDVYGGSGGVLFFPGISEASKQRRGGDQNTGVAPVY